MEGHTVLGDSSDEALAEEVYQEPSDVINDAIDLKEVIEIIEGSENTYEDIIDIDIDSFGKTTATERTSNSFYS